MSKLHIWVDADACPVVVRDIIVRAAMRKKLFATFVANSFVRLPTSPFIKMCQVPQGFDVADNEIVERIQQGDIVITGDIPLASEVIAKGAHALNTRGELFTKENIGSRLNMRDFMESMRSSGVHTGGPPPFSDREKMAFANQLDRLLAKH